ncbi:MAG: hypothetical protein ABR552_10515 [Actinomycetota bacterium]
MRKTTGPLLLGLAGLAFHAVVAYHSTFGQRLDNFPVRFRLSIYVQLWLPLLLAFAIIVSMFVALDHYMAGAAPAGGALAGLGGLSIINAISFLIADTSWVGYVFVLGGALYIIAGLLAISETAGGARAMRVCGLGHEMAPDANFCAICGSPPVTGALPDHQGAEESADPA